MRPLVITAIVYRRTSLSLARQWHESRWPALTLAAPHLNAPKISNDSNGAPRRVRNQTAPGRVVVVVVASRVMCCSVAADHNYPPRCWTGAP